ncbi:MAG: PH domain-containing protein [Alphaproteobacteria bacterium]|nr:PH domain-containing protein [Alphaproteobacteria bacterium]
MTIDVNSLEPGEHLLWQGEPNARRFSERAFIASAWVGLSLLGFALLILLSLYLGNTAPGPDARALAGGLIVVGAFLACRPLWVRRDLRRMRYALTNRRAIIERPGVLLRNRFSVPYSHMRRIEFRNRHFEKFIETGDVLFRDYTIQTEDGPQHGRDGFLALTDFAQVGQLLREQIEATRGESLTEVGADDWRLPYDARASATSANP